MLLDSQTELSAASEVEAFGERKRVSEWARDKGLDTRTLQKRLDVMPAETALSLPAWVRIRHARYAIPPGEPNSWTWESLSYADDPWAQRFVADNPSGATLEDVGAALGITRERVRQIEDGALRKLKRGSGQVRLRALMHALELGEGREVWRWRAG